jgi:hypothetical protein
VTPQHPRMRTASYDASRRAANADAVDIADSLRWPNLVNGPHNVGSAMRINFLNPFGTDACDDLIREMLEPTLRPDVKLDVTHLDVAPVLSDSVGTKLVRRSSRWRQRR